MKIYKYGLRLWITVTSILTFILGWILLAHAPKPVQASSASTESDAVAPLPTLQPLPPLNGNTFNSDDGSNFQFQNQQPFFNNQAARSFRQKPFFSTGGS